MKKMKKMLSLMLVLAMLPVSAMSVSAEKESGISYTFSKWNVNKITSNTPWNSKTDYVRVTTDGGYNGTPGAEVNIMSPVESNRYLGLSTGLSAKMNGGSTYRVRLRYKGTGNFAIHFNWQGRSNASTYIKESTDGDWIYAYKDITMPEGKESPNIQFIFEAKQYSVIDDVSIQLLTDTDGDGKADTPNGTELIADPGFSQYKTSYSFDIEPEALFSSVTWKSENAALSDTPGGIAQVTRKYAHSGDYAMYAKGETANGYMIIQPTPAITFEKGKSYKIEFYTMYTVGNTAITTEWERWGEARSTSAWGEITPDSKGWVKRSRVITPTANRGNLWFLLDAAEEIIIDDVSIYLLDAEGNPTGNNLVVDGGFESSIAPAENKYSFADWKSFKSKDTLDKRYYSEPTKKYAKNGDFSMHLSYPTATEAHHYITAAYPTDIPVGTYLVQYYAKGKASGLSITTGIGSGISGSRASGAGTYSDWTLVEKILPVTSEGTNNFLLLGQNRDNVYIDDLKVYPVTAKNSSAAISLSNYEIAGEAIIDENFENAVENTDAMAVNLVAYPLIEGKKLSISWKNPLSYTIDDIKLYVNNERTEITPIDKSYGAFNQMIVYKMNNNQKYDIRLEMLIDGTEYVYETTGTPDGLGKTVKLSNWTTLRTETGTEYANTVVTAEKEEDGNTAMRIKSNIPQITPQIYGNLITETMTLLVNTEYVLKFRYKADNISNFAVRQDCTLNDTTSSTRAQIINTKTTTNGWIEKEITLRPEGVYDDSDMDDTTYTSAILFLVEEANGSLWIDDVELYAIIDFELDDTNLISNGDFEFGDYQILKPEYTLVAKDGTRTAINEIKEGTIEVTAKIKNLAKGNDFTPAVIVALYNGTKLEKTISVTEKTITENSIIFPAEEITAAIDVPATEGNDYSIKVMYWNGLGSLEPLAEYDVLGTVK